MQTIELNHGMSTQVSDEDFDFLSKFQWRARHSKERKKWYVTRSITGKHGKVIAVRYMHREIMEAKKGTLVDHRDGNSLNNQRENLRFATIAQNNANARPRSNGASPYKGVSQYKGRWQAEISSTGVKKYLGRFDTQEEAALAYNKAARELYGEFAYQNIIPSTLGGAIAMPND